MKKAAKKLALNKETLKILTDPEEALGRIRGGDGDAEIAPTRRRTLCLGTCDCAVS